MGLGHRAGSLSTALFEIKIITPTMSVTLPMILLERLLQQGVNMTEDLNIGLRFIRLELCPHFPPYFLHPTSDIPRPRVEKCRAKCGLPRYRPRRPSTQSLSIWLAIRRLLAQNSTTTIFRLPNFKVRHRTRARV